MDAAPPTPVQIARYGHIAARLREFLAASKMAVPELNVMMGLPRGNNAAYPWINGKGSPSPQMRAKLSVVTGIAEDDLTPRDIDPPVRIVRATRLDPTRAVPPEAWGQRPPAKAVDVVPPDDHALAFTVTRTGQARIKLDVTMPLDKATPLLRLLLDAGVVVTGE